MQAANEEQKRQMHASLDRIILYVQDVDGIARFYKDAFEFPVVQQIEGEWVVLRAGACELSLHRVGKPYRLRTPPPGESRRTRNWSFQCRAIYTKCAPG